MLIIIFDGLLNLQQLF